jgi:hypothetical protein
MKINMMLSLMIGMDMATGFNVNSYLPRNIPSIKEKQTDEEREKALFKAQQKRDRKAKK